MTCKTSSTYMPLFFFRNAVWRGVCWLLALSQNSINLNEIKNRNKKT